MVEPFDEHETHEPHASHEPGPGDDFPPDLFDDEPEASSDKPTHFPPAPAHLHAGDEASVEPKAHPSTHREAAPHVPTSELRSSFPSDIPIPEHDALQHHPAFPLVMGLALVGALVGAVAYNMKTAPETPAPAPAPVASTSEPAPAPAPSTATATAPANEIKEIQSDVADLEADIKELQDKIAALSKTESAADLKPLQAQVAELSKSTEAVAPLSKKVEDLDAHVGEMDKSLTDLKTEIVSLRDEVKKAGEQAAAAAASKPATTSTSAALPALDEGIKLYKGGKYKDADTFFSKLTATNPEDARIWYFAALSNGFATNQWTGKPAELVLKGIEREKAGTPSSSEIDAAFGDLTKNNGKDWLSYYRKNAAK
jgi:TolA-binding protein